MATTRLEAEPGVTIELVDGDLGDRKDNVFVVRLSLARLVAKVVDEMTGLDVQEVVLVVLRVGGIEVEVRNISLVAAIDIIDGMSECR